MPRQPGSPEDEGGGGGGVGLAYSHCSALELKRLEPKANISVLILKPNSLILTPPVPERGCPVRSSAPLQQIEVLRAQLFLYNLSA